MSDSQYCWIVICKNHKFHRHQNLFSGHRILLGETDAFTPNPPIDTPLTIRCVDCGKEYDYRPAEILRYQINLPASFAPHPLFYLEFDLETHISICELRVLAPFRFQTAALPLDSTVSFPTRRRVK